MNFYVFGLINFIIKAGFELVKQNRLTKNSERSEEIGPTQAKKFLICESFYGKWKEF